MGYTHYFSTKNLKGLELKKAQTKYEKAITKCNKVIRAYSLTHGGLSGYSAYTTTKQYKGIKLNGSQNSGMCEDFILPELYKDLNSGDFCKTNRYAYDNVVVACLIILSNELKGLFNFNSDGTKEDLNFGLELSKLVIGKKYLVPEHIREGRDTSCLRAL